MTASSCGTVSIMSDYSPNSPMLKPLGAIQTLLRIFDAYGDNLSPEAWSICIKSVLFKLLSSIERELEAANESDGDDKDKSEWNETAVVVLNGISTLLANYLDVLTQHASFHGLWKELLSHFGTLLDFRILSVNTATFNALGKILGQTRDLTSPFSEESSEASWELWSRGVPKSKEEDGQGADNQNCLLAYVSALTDVYRLTRDTLTVERVKRMLILLREAMQQASMGAYATDVENMTQLQSKILETVGTVRADIPGVPSAMISQVAEFVTLAFGPDAPKATPKKRTFIAMSKTSMGILQSLILDSASDGDIYTSGAFTAALSALSRPIALKYGFPIVTKSEQPWRLATTTVLAMLEATLSQLHAHEIPDATIQNIWQEIVTGANGIVSADCSHPPQEGKTVAEDEAFDVEAFTKLRGLIIPSLGAEKIPDRTRKAFADSLFRTSIIHEPSPEEMKLLEGSSGDALATLLHKSRHGGTQTARPTRRPRMSYVCLDELFSLVAAYDDPSTPSITVQPPTPKFPTGRGGGVPNEASGTLHTRIARAAAPFLILRACLALRAYVSDQPLRGRMPQPLSQRRELLHILAALTDLRSESEAIPDVEGVESEARKHLVRVYPLLVAVGGVAGGAGDEEVLGRVGEALGVVGGEFGI